MIYAYYCDVGKHGIDHFASTAPKTLHCDTHNVECNRDFSTVSIKPSNDIFRKTYLSEAARLKNEQRGHDFMPNTPRDKFEAKEIERATGRTYFGNDYSNLSADCIEAAKQNGDL